MISGRTDVSPVLHVQPRSRKKMRSSGTGTPMSQRKIHPILPGAKARGSSLGFNFIQLHLRNTHAIIGGSLLWSPRWK